ncbi:MAG: hypothetical protein MHPSP_000884, partial [Paramarteilia canceri]
ELAKSQDFTIDRRNFPGINKEPSCKDFIYKPSENITKILRKSVSVKKDNELFHNLEPNENKIEKDEIKPIANENNDSKSNIASLNIRTGTSDADNDSSDSEIIIDFDQGMENNDNMKSENAVKNLNELVEQRIENTVKRNSLIKMDSGGSALNESNINEVQNKFGLTYSEMDVLLGLNK